ncbi:Uncharacterized protein FWK35_00027600, partial [Aphis craccivora]
RCSNGLRPQKLANPGITTTLKGYCSYNKTNITSHHNSGWDNDIKNANKYFIESGNFNGCINLKDLSGFCEDYKRILINCNQQLILNRASLDINAVKQVINSDDTIEDLALPLAMENSNDEDKAEEINLEGRRIVDINHIFKSIK